ncbi:MAG: hypothetical protein IT406_02875 [Candidatus Yanofskybacteria bacterium]|nr:hypothetical protein [Candidatus Yanofskybacteria bacterium]
MASTLRHTTVLVDGIGSGGERIPLVAWLLFRGARVAIAERRSPEVCAPLVRRVEERLKKGARDGREYEHLRARCEWFYGGSRAPHNADVVVRTAADEAGLFFAHRRGGVVGVTGLHGKTTAAIWAAHLIGDAVVAGHSPERSLFSAIDEGRKVVVAEFPTVLARTMPAVRSVVRVGDAGDLAGFDAETFVARWGKHNLPAGHAAVAVARAAGASDARIASRLATLPEVSDRQEIVHQDARCVAVNDAAAVTPEHGVAAIERWGGPTTILVAGGGGARGAYAAWADAVRSHIRRTNLILVSGGATRSMREALGAWGVGVRAYESLQAACAAAQRRAGVYVSSVILFSPAADVSGGSTDIRERGRQFNAFVEERS